MLFSCGLVMSVLLTGQVLLPPLRGGVILLGQVPVAGVCLSA